MPGRLDIDDPKHTEMMILMMLASLNDGERGYIHFLCVLLWFRDLSVKNMSVPSEGMGFQF